MKLAIQVDNVVRKAYGILAFISLGIEYRGREVMLNFINPWSDLNRTTACCSSHLNVGKM